MIVISPAEMRRIERRAKVWARALHCIGKFLDGVALGIGIAAGLGLCWAIAA